MPRAVPNTLALLRTIELHTPKARVTEALPVRALAVPRALVGAAAIRFASAARVPWVAEAPPRDALPVTRTIIRAPLQVTDRNRVAISTSISANRQHTTADTTAVKPSTGDREMMGRVGRMDGKASRT